MISGDLKFVDEDGTVVTLDTYFGQEKPVIVQLVYFECPMLCNLVINGFSEGAGALAWKPGSEYTVLSISFDPRDTPELAQNKKANYVEALGIPEAKEGWHFLTGEPDQVEALAEALGFPYRYLEKTEEFSHGAGMFVLTPDGKISRTLYGIDFPQQLLKFSLMEASKGRLGSPLDKVILYCFRYDSKAHRYGFVAINAMKIGGALSVLVLGTFLVIVFAREQKKAHAA